MWTVVLGIIHCRRGGCRCRGIACLAARPLLLRLLRLILATVTLTPARIRRLWQLRPQRLQQVIGKLRYGFLCGRDRRALRHRSVEREVIFSRRVDPIDARRGARDARFGERYFIDSSSTFLKTAAWNFDSADHDAPSWGGGEGGGGEGGGGEGGGGEVGGGEGGGGDGAGGKGGDSDGGGAEGGAEGGSDGGS